MLCRKIAEETDPQKTHDLLYLLHAVVRDDTEEIRIRLAFLVKKYGIYQDLESIGHRLQDTRAKAAGSDPVFK